MTPKLSLFLVVKDAERLLPAVVANGRRLADEVLIVVDQESQDETLQIAQQLADRVAFWRVGGSYESVLNEAARLCMHDWILYGHDDELWTPAFRAQLPALLNGPCDEYMFPRRHVIGPGGREWINSEPWWPDWQLRLRTRHAWQAAPWPRLVHSVPPPVNRQQVDLPIWHLKFMVKSTEARAARLARWAALWEPAGNDHYRRFSLAEEYAWQACPLPEDAPEELNWLLATADVSDHEPAAIRA